MTNEKPVAVTSDLLEEAAIAMQAAWTARSLLARGVDDDELDLALEVVERRSRSVVRGLSEALRGRQDIDLREAPVAPSASEVRPTVEPEAP